MSDTLKAIGYIRVSTEEQASDDRYGIEAQKREILLYADNHNYHIVKWFIDHISGTSDDRPEWNKILSGDEVTNPPYEAVIAFKSDRIARDTKLYFYYLYVLEKRNIKMISTQEVFPEGEFANIYRALMLFVAEQERKNIALRTGRGRSVKAACGGYSGGRCPYGYKVVDGRLVVLQEEAEMVKRIFKMLKAEKTLQFIADDLNDAGYRTRKGTRFQVSTIRSIRDNGAVYLGKYKYGKDMSYVDGVHEPILDYDEYHDFVFNTED